MLATLLWLRPWLATFAIAACLAYELACLIPADSTSTEYATSAGVTTIDATTQACDTSDNPQLVYALSTGRLPADYCRRQGR